MMSDPTRMTREDLESTIAGDHRTAAPVQPGPGALGRVRERALALAGETATATPGRWPRPAVWRLAAAAAVVTITVGLSLAVVGTGGTAFAREKLLAALAPTGSVLHYTESSSTAQSADGAHDATYTSEVWIDAERETLRREDSVGDGNVISLMVESGGRVRYVFLAPALDDTGGQDEGDSIWQLSESPATGPSGAIGQPEFNPFWWLDLLRDAVSTGEAEVTGETTVNGDECWELSWDYAVPDDPRGTVEVLTAIVRQSDYRPMQWSAAVVVEGQEQASFSTEITGWEVLPRESVDAAIFDRSSIGAEAAVETRVYSPADLSDFDEYDAWWLGPEFEGRALTGWMVAEEAGEQAPSGDITYNRGAWVGNAWFFEETGGELVATYSEDLLDEGSLDDVRVVVIPRRDEQALAEALAGMARSFAGRDDTYASEIADRTSGGRAYVERVETWSGGGASRALLNLGDATVLVVAPDSATTGRAVAALVKGN